jgi:hypothetical protein
VEWRADDKIERSIPQAKMAELERIVREVSGLDNVRWERRITMAANQAGWNNAQPSATAGYYATFAKSARVVASAIVLSMDRVGINTAFHEAFYHVQRVLLSAAEREILKSEGARLRAAVTKARSTDVAAGMSEKEVETEAFALYATEMLHQQYGLQSLPAPVRTAWMAAHDGSSFLRIVYHLSRDKHVDALEDGRQRAFREFLVAVIG